MTTSLSTLTILSLQILILLLGSFCIDEINGGGVLDVVNKVQREFDYFALALQWPGTYCSKTRKCCSTNACCRGSNSPTHFTIHGLWPDYNDGTWPSCCTESDFDEKEISTLLGALEEYWPSLSCSKASTCSGGKGLFWAHEWEKHGTCSTAVFKDEYTYFLATLNIYFKYNVTEVLFEAGYVPSNTEKYPIGGIITAIQNAFHATPQLICKKGALEELRLCFYKDFTPRDCVDSAKSSCPDYVSLPAYSSLGLGNGETAVSWLPGSEAI